MILKRIIHRFLPLVAMLMMLGVSACSSIDCPLNNTVYTNYKLMKTDIVPDTLRDTLNIWVVRPGMTDSIIINRNLNTMSLKLPISFTNDVDVLCFQRKNGAGLMCIDTVRIAKTNTPHFESVDCAPNYFHEITAVTTTHNGIDSIAIKHKTVDYDAKDNFYIYFKALH